MPLDNLPDVMTLPQRTDLVAQWKRDVQFIAPTVNTDAKTYPDIIGRATADIVLPVYVEAFRQAEIGSLAGKAAAGQSVLDQECIDSGLPTQLPAAGSAGFVIVQASASGGLIQAGDLIKNVPTGVVYECTQTGTYLPGQLCPVEAQSATGPSTNLAPGTILQWTSPRPGILPLALVYQQSSGGGLTGGADQETQAQQIARIQNARANPAVSGNDAAYQLAALKTPGVAVQQVFTHPCIIGPGLGALLFLVRPSVPGASRIPNTTQIALVKAYVIGQFPKDDNIAFCFVTAQPTDVVLRLRWSPGVASWTDAAPWPPYSSATNPYTIDASVVPSATTFAVSTNDGSPVAPSVGQIIALYNPSAVTTATPQSAFVRKRILTVSGADPWTITVDTSNNASDTQFTPTIGDRVMPWSDSLGLLVLPIVQYFDALGPGEQVATFYDAGYRQKRNPPDPAVWPASITTKMLVPLLALPAVLDTQVASPALPFAPTVGTPFTFSNLLTLNHLYVLPE